MILVFISGFIVGALSTMLWALVLSDGGDDFDNFD